MGLAIWMVHFRTTSKHRARGWLLAVVEAVARLCDAFYLSGGFLCDSDQMAVVAAMLWDFSAVQLFLGKAFKGDSDVLEASLLEEKS